MGVLLVTGGGRGIGADIARLAAQRGWHVGINFTSDETSAQAVANEVRACGVNAAVVQADVPVPEHVQKLFDQVTTQLGPIMALVNSAGVATGIGPIDDLDLDDTKRMFEVNVFRLYLCCRAGVMGNHWPE